VRCTHCEGVLEVAPRAMSVFCPHCNKRLVIEDIRIQRYYAVREIATCGDVVVGKRGHAVAAIRADNLIVEGKVSGDVVAVGCVRVASTASLTGDIRARGLSVEDGAAIHGFLRIEDAPAEPDEVISPSRPSRKRATRAAP
jgi:predicted acyltransferase (DUF342 family)